LTRRTEGKVWESPIGGDLRGEAQANDLLVWGEKRKVEKKKQKRLPGEGRIQIGEGKAPRGLNGEKK